MDVKGMRASVDADDEELDVGGAELECRSLASSLGQV